MLKLQAMSSLYNALLQLYIIWSLNIMKGQYRCQVQKMSFRSSANILNNRKLQKFHPLEPLQNSVSSYEIGSKIQQKQQKIK